MKSSLKGFLSEAIRKKEETLEETSEESPEVEAHKILTAEVARKRQYEKETEDLLDMGFYFSVVFPTRKARDEWLEKHNILLRDDDHCRPEDLGLDEPA